MKRTNGRLMLLQVSLQLGLHSDETGFGFSIFRDTTLQNHILQRATQHTSYDYTVSHSIVIHSFMRKLSNYGIAKEYPLIRRITLNFISFSLSSCSSNVFNSYPFGWWTSQRSKKGSSRTRRNEPRVLQARIFFLPFCLARYFLDWNDSFRRPSCLFERGYL